jgi:hypothetical protein
MNLQAFQIYHLLHILGVVILFAGFGALASGNRKGMMYHGIGLLILVIAGFGFLARQKMGYTSPFLIGKYVIFAVLAVLPVLARKKIVPAGAMLWIAIVLGAVAALLGYTKAMPF